MQTCKLTKPKLWHLWISRQDTAITGGGQWARHIHRSSNSILVEQKNRQSYVLRDEQVDKTKYTKTTLTEPRIIEISVVVVVFPHFVKV